MSPVAELHHLPPDVVIWHAFDTSVKAELFSTALQTPQGSLIVDPIPLSDAAIKELIRDTPVSGVVVTNSNHHRQSLEWSARFSVPLFAHRDAFKDDKPARLHEVGSGEKILNTVEVISIDGAPAGEIALHSRTNGGTLIMGDSLINFDHHGFTFLPAKYCENQKAMKKRLRHLVEFPAQRLFFAHGEPILRNATNRLRELLDEDASS